MLCVSGTLPYMLTATGTPSPITPVGHLEVDLVESRESWPQAREHGVTGKAPIVTVGIATV